MIQKLSYLLLSVFITVTASATEFTGKDAHKKFPGAERVLINEISNVPSFIVFPDHVQIDEEKVMHLLRDGLGMNAEDSWKLYKIQKDKIGFTHKRFNQYYNNIKVETGEYILHIKNGNVKHINGVFYDNLNINSSPSLSEASALQSALDHIGARTYKWENQIEEAYIKLFEDDMSATYYPKGELVIMAKDAVFKPEEREFRLCYKFDVYADMPMSRDYVYVDAHNGEIVYKQSRICHGNAVGTANTRYAGTQTINTDSLSPTSYRLRDYTKGAGVLTWDLNNGT
ncbi:MAG: hypothetical protein HKN22_08580, partial [Bacteroidia bacterium]|nr:hypothetical protein [Bacteroidia bacterium]